MCAWVSTVRRTGRSELVHRRRERLPLRAHHQGVDHGDAVVVDDDARVGDAGLAPRQQPRVDAVGELGEGDLVGHVDAGYARSVSAVRPGAGASSTLARMSERSRSLPRRTCLAVPGSSEKMLGKAPGLGADMVFLDLEDSVAPLEKEAARDNVVQAIRELDWGDTVVCVRVNAWDTKWTYRDVIHVVENAGERLDEIMLPKVQYAERRRRARPAAHADRGDHRTRARASASKRRSRPRAG